MLIKQSNVALNADHTLETHAARQIRLLQSPRADSAFARLLDSELQSPPAELLTVEAAAPPSAANPAESPFHAIVEMLLGLSRALEHVPQLEGLPQFEGPGGGRAFRVMAIEHTTERESCSFAASGNVCLADGSTRDFDVGYRLERSEETDRVSVGEFRDPLMLDFARPGGLGRQSVNVDLDLDGKAERMRMPDAGGAVLVNDLNHNGKVDDGSELFGPRSGDGFAELAKLDGDGNGWIDSGDAAYAGLGLWQANEDGTTRLRSLAEAEIGALSTRSAATPFTLKEDGQAVGQVRASGVWLGEKSGAGVIRQIDVATTPAEPNAA